MGASRGPPPPPEAVVLGLLAVQLRACVIQPELLWIWKGKVRGRAGGCGPRAATPRRPRRCPPGR